MKGPSWYERACDQIEDDYVDGLIDSSEYHAQMRDLNDELRGAADEAAEEARDSYLGGW